jgi:hypothetical protein
MPDQVPADVTMSVESIAVLDLPVLVHSRLTSCNAVSVTQVVHIRYVVEPSRGKSAAGNDYLTHGNSPVVT